MSGKIRAGAVGFCFAVTVMLRSAEVRGAEIPQPEIADKKFQLTDFGGVGDGHANNTEALKRAVEAVEKGGGGMLVVPAGVFLTDPFKLASHLNLHLEKGATILMSPLDPAAKFYENCISADGCTDIAITGEGTIDGQGKLTWDRYRKVKDAATGKMVSPTGTTHRPYMVVLKGCTRVLVEGVTFTNSPSFHLVPGQCTDVVIDGAKFIAPSDAPNTDALDPSGKNFLITHCTFDVGDDDIAVKASGKGTPENPSCENFTVTDCTFKHGHGLSIGGQSNGCMRNMMVRDCTFEGTEAGIRLKAGRGSGGLVENLTYENLTMNKVKVPIFITSYYPTAPEDAAGDPAQAVSATTPIWRNVHIRNLHAENSPTAGIIIGLPEMPIDGVVMEDVHISANKGMKIVNAKGIEFVRSTIESKDKKPLVVQKAEVKGLE